MSCRRFAVKLGAAHTPRTPADTRRDGCGQGCTIVGDGADFLGGAEDRVQAPDSRAPAPRGGAHRRGAVEGVGPVPQRAPVGHGPRGLQRGRRRLELLHPRPGALARLPLGRGRDRRDLRRAPAAVPGAGAVERRRPDPQGADVRPHQRRGQPRRGRQGVLVLPRQHADALLHEVPVQVPAARVSLRGPRRDQRGAAASRTWSTSCSTPASSTTTATST